MTGYPRSTVLRKGLEKLGLGVSECHVSHKQRLPVRYTNLFLKYMFSKRDFSVIYVPEFRHKDVPLAWLLGKLTRKIVVFDPLVSRFDTKVRDRGDAGEYSLQAWHNKNLDRMSLALPDLVLADTEAHAEYYISQLGASENKVRVLPVGFDEELFKLPIGGEAQLESIPREPSKFTVLFYGTYLPLHGVPTIVEAAKALRNQQDIVFELIGGGQTFEDVESYVNAEGLENVRLMRRVPTESLPGRISSASLCLGIFGKTDKALRVVPNKVYQCMAMGKTVVTAASRAIREHFVDGDTICLVPPGDAEALAEKINYLASSPEDNAGIGARAYRLLHERYQSKRIAESFLDYCNEAVG